MAISQNSKILAKDIKDELDRKANATDVLSLEEIRASTDLAGKIASASALKATLVDFKYHIDGDSLSFKAPEMGVLIINGSGNNDYYIGTIKYGKNLDKVVSNNAYDSSIEVDKSSKVITLPTSGWYTYVIIK